MGFFNFFKRDISEEEFQEQQKVKRGLEKTRTGFFQRIVNTLTNAQIDDDLYDQLEEQLILADVGPACAVRLVDELHDEVKGKHLKTGQEALDALRGIICQRLIPAADGGLTTAYEILINNMAVGNIISEGKAFKLKSTMQIGNKQGMCTLDQCLLEKYKAGLITYEVAKYYMHDQAETAQLEREYAIRQAQQLQAN